MGYLKMEGDGAPPSGLFPLLVCPSLCLGGNSFSLLSWDGLRVLSP